MTTNLPMAGSHCTAATAFKAVADRTTTASAPDGFDNATLEFDGYMNLIRVNGEHPDTAKPQPTAIIPPSKAYP